LTDFAVNFLLSVPVQMIARCLEDCLRHDL